MIIDGELVEGQLSVHTPNNIKTYMSPLYQTKMIARKAEMDVEEVVGDGGS